MSGYKDRQPSPYRGSRASSGGKAHRPGGVRTTLAPLATNGVVTRLTVTVAGTQHGKIDVTDAETPGALVRLTWSTLSMVFTSAEQVQHLLGFFGMCRAGQMGMADLQQLPGIGSDPGGLRHNIVWTRTPMAAVTRETWQHPVTQKVWPVLALEISPIVVYIMDRTALASMIGDLIATHRLAVATFPDGAAFRDNPLAQSWKPKPEHHMRTIGSGFITQKHRTEPGQLL